MSNLKDRLIRIGNSNPNLRKHIRPVLDRLQKSARTSQMQREASFTLDVMDDLVKQAGQGRVVGTGRSTAPQGNLNRGVTWELNFNDSGVRQAVMNLPGSYKEWEPTLTIDAYDHDEWEIWARNDKEMIVEPRIVPAPDPERQEGYFREQMLPVLDEVFSELGRWGLNLIDEAGTAPKWSMNMKEPWREQFDRAAEQLDVSGMDASVQNDIMEGFGALNKDKAPKRAMQKFMKARQDVSGREGSTLDQMIAALHGAGRTSSNSH